MKGIEYIRKRCNISESELANQLHVTRQAISMWENGKKKIPEARKRQLATFFGIDEKYLDDISEEDKKYILSKAMFKRYIAGKETYCYIPDDAENPELYFYADSEKTLDEEYSLAVNRKHSTLKRAERFIEGHSVELLMDKTLNINNGCDRINLMIDIFEMPYSKKSPLKVPFRYEMVNIIKAMQYAYGFKTKEEYIADLTECDTLPQDIDFFMGIAERFGEHWKKEEDRIITEYNQHKLNRRSHKQKTDERTLEERITSAEKEIRERNDNGDSTTTITWV